MVEGPGATRNGHKAQEFLHREILNVQCSCNDNVVTKNDDKGNPWFDGRYLSEVFSIGKELWLIFSRIESKQCGDENNDDSALMLHFGMNGALRSNSMSRSNSHHTQPTLSLGFGDSIECKNSLAQLRGTSYFPHHRIDTIEAFQTTVHGPVTAASPRKKYSNFTSVDVCSINFNPDDVLRKIKSSESRDRVISDVILDQYIYPGVGNIIKVEGLHQSKINPKQPVPTIPDVKLNTLILACRAYAIQWLNNGKAPAKHVYNQTICKSCNQATISMQRVGGSNRTTFWCIRCQPMMIKPNGHSDSNQSQNQSTNMVSTTTSLQRVCPTHGPDPLVLRRVRKGVNTSRIFHTCKVKNCNYFAWADTYFPSCKCKKRTTLFISKTEKTGGKWFFTCSNKGKRCGYFSWAKTTDLEKLGGTLHPLL